MFSEIFFMLCDDWNFIISMRMKKTKKYRNVCIKDKKIIAPLVPRVCYNYESHSIV
jgi:hypothetical protein